MIFNNHLHLSGLSGQDFHFDENGDGRPRYRILNFRQLTPGEFKWVSVGLYEDHNLTVNPFLRYQISRSEYGLIVRARVQTVHI